MTECHDIHRLAAGGGPLEGREVEAHLEACAPCRELAAEAELARALAEDAAAARLDDALDDELEGMLGRVTARVEAERGPRAWLRSRSTPLRLALGLAAVALTGSFALVTAPREDLVVYPLDRMALVLGAMAAAAAVSLIFGLRPLWRPSLGSAPRWSVILGVPAGVVALALAPEAPSLHPASLAGGGAEFAPAALACFAYGAALGLPIVALLRAAERRERWPLAQALLAAAAAGLAGNLALQLHCPITDPWHLLWGHASVSLALPLVLGVVAVARATTPRTSSSHR